MLSHLGREGVEKKKRRTKTKNMLRVLPRTIKHLTCIRTKEKEDGQKRGGKKMKNKAEKDLNETPSKRTT